MVKNTTIYVPEDAKAELERLKAEAEEALSLKPGHLSMHGLLLACTWEKVQELLAVRRGLDFYTKKFTKVLKEKAPKEEVESVIKHLEEATSRLASMGFRVLAQEVNATKMIQVPEVAVEDVLSE